jgi:hypothetical protein
MSDWWTVVVSPKVEDIFEEREGGICRRKRKEKKKKKERISNRY